MKTTVPSPPGLRRVLTNRKPLVHLVLCLLAYSLLVGAFVVWENQHTEQGLYEEIDKRLLLVATSLKYLLAPDFHDRTVGPDSIPMDEIKRNQDVVSGFARSTSFEYIYTLVEYQGKFYFSAPTVTPEELKQKESWYYHPYDDIPEEFVKAFREHSTVFVSYSDQWGTFRSVAMYEESPGGRPYLACADYEVGYIKGLLWRNYAYSIITALVMLLFSIPFLLFYRTLHRTYTRELENLVDIRTSELRHAKEEAEAANRIKSEFISNVSHELRTPLTSIIGFTTMIQQRLFSNIFPRVPDTYSKKEKDAQIVERNLNIIAKEADRLTTLINDILDIERIEAGKVQLHLQPLDIRSVVDKAVETTSVLADRKKLSITTMYADVPLMIMADKDRMQQVMINLIANGLKFTEQGGIECKVSIANDTLTISVSDTGPGIPQDKRETIFESFVQIETDKKDKPEGSGLGLAICRGIVELHGGTINMESEEGKGSRFNVTLPVRPMEREP